ncbi:MAG: SRPBCC family protein [Myxococcota bacterium]|nr:SRPBCC family protein [Myxococcota bacterium]
MNTILLLLSLHGIPASIAADPNKPHPHQGVATVFSNPQPVSLSDAEKRLLQSGKPVLKQVKQGNGGRGIAVMDVKGTEEEVWNVITDYPSYPKRIPELKTTSNYSVDEKNIYTRFIISKMMVSVEYFIKHDLHKDKGYITWTLDYTRESDLDDSTGYWLLYPSPDNPGQTRVEYSVDIRIKGWIPKFIETMLADQGLEDATKWVKKAVEK